MNVVVAMDSFKGSLTSLEAGEAVREGVIRAFPHAQVQLFSLADGGEGTVTALVQALNGQMVTLQVPGPLGAKVLSHYGLIAAQNTAIIEVAQAAGLEQVPTSLRNPMKTTSFGVGCLIKDAMERGIRKFIIGLGGSATVDGGAGMLCALGFSLTDSFGLPIPAGGDGLQTLTHISSENKLPGLDECRFTVASDVTNPLCGHQGAASIFGPQKGASAKQVQLLEEGLLRIAQLTPDNTAHWEQHKGAGAAGGLGFAFLAFLHAEIKSGVEVVMDAIGLQEAIALADLVITGEGKMDTQTMMGKAPFGVALRAARMQKTILAFAGTVDPDAKTVLEQHFTMVQSIKPESMTLNDALMKENARQNLSESVYNNLSAFVMTRGKGLRSSLLRKCR